MKKIFLLVSFAVALNAFSQTPNYVPTNGLVGYWPFTGNANDISANGNNGAPQNGVALTTDRLNNNNSAYNFDGIDDQIEVPHASSISPTGEVSVSAWIYPRAYEDNKHCVSKGSHINLTYRSYSIQGPWADGKWKFFLNGGGIETVISSTSNAVLNSWN